MGLGFNLHLCQTHPDRHLTPQLEEKWDIGPQALIPNIGDPVLQHWYPHLCLGCIISS